MARRTRDRYSRFVSLLRVVLPLAALALLSTLFLLSRNVDTEAVIPFGEAEIETRTRAQQITAPFFSGVTPKGDEISLAATVARPGTDGSPAGAEDVIAILRMQDGTRLNMSSARATFDMQDQSASLLGNVVIQSSIGYRLTTAILNTAINRIDAATPGIVEGTGPIGALHAGRMRITSDTETGDLHLFFTNGVKLIYEPPMIER